MGSTIPTQMGLGCIRKAVEREPGSKLINNAQCSPTPRFSGSISAL